VAKEDLEEEWVDRDRELVDLPIADVPSVGIQYPIGMEHHA